MQEVTEETVLGDFDDAEFSYAGVTSKLFRRADEFWVQTDGPDGEYITEWEQFGMEKRVGYM